MQRLANAFSNADLAGELFAHFAVNCFDRSFGEVDATTRQVNVIAGSRACNQTVGVDHNRVGAFAGLA